MIKHLLLCFALDQFTENGVVLGVSWLLEAWADCHVCHPLVQGWAMMSETKFAVIMDASI